MRLLPLLPGPRSLALRLAWRGACDDAFGSRPARLSLRARTAHHSDLMTPMGST
jgi:hypothetical protein